MHTSSIKSVILTLLAVCLSLPISLTGATDGTIPNQSYPPSELWTDISPQLSSRHYNQPVFFNGYAIFCGNGVHDVWDIENPYNPILQSTLTSPHSVNNSSNAESHQVTFARYGDTFYMATISGKGFDIWDVTNTTSPSFVSTIVLPNINYGDVTGGIWGLSWQGGYIYAGATTYGLYVVDVSDPENPDLVKTYSRNNLGGVAAGPLWALGNLLVVTTPKGHSGLATVSIKDSENPILLDSVDNNRSSYIGSFYDNQVFLLGGWFNYDVLSDPENISFITDHKGRPKSEYYSFANDYMYLGGLRGDDAGIFKYDITDPYNWNLVGRFPGRDSRWDDQFSCPIGNILLVADDQRVDNQHVGGIIVVESIDSDTQGPSVKQVIPKAGATDQALSTKIGLSLSEWSEFKSVGPSTFIVRPVGGAALSGIYSTTTTTINFAPDSPLEPTTEYEIVLPSGGITDGVGNAISDTYVSSFFTTGPSGPGDGLGNSVISGTLSGVVGDAFELTVANPDAEKHYRWEMSDGTTYEGVSISHIYQSEGRHIVTLETLSSSAGSAQRYEAENAVLSGGVVVATNNAGWSGTGIADYPSDQGSNVKVKWNINRNSNGAVNLVFGYANLNNPRPLRLVVNGTTLFNVLHFPVTGDWRNYDTVNVDNVSLNAGNNTIELIADAGSPGPNLDYLDIVSLADGEVEASTSAINIVHYPLTPNEPLSSQAILLDESSGLLWAVNQDSQTISAVDTTTFSKVAEVYSGVKPATIAQAANGDLWVVNQGSDNITIHDSTAGLKIDTIDLPVGSEPYGIVFDHVGSTAFVTLQSSGQLVKIDTLSGNIINTLQFDSGLEYVVPEIRGLAFSSDGQSLFVTRFVSPDSGGEVYEVNPQTLSLIDTIHLAKSTVEDTALGGRGIPNYLVSATISPDGRELWLPSKQDNIDRGGFLDGNPLSSENTVRSIISRVDMSSRTEDLDGRLDLDNQDRPHQLVFSELGDLIFAAMPSNDHVTVLDAYTGQQVTTIAVGKAPQGVLQIGNSLYVLNFLSRSLSIFDITDLLNGNIDVEFLAEVDLVEYELLPDQILLGKQLFYNASSEKLNSNGYMSCASCHLDGGNDGRVWDLSDLGEGLRNTIDLRGHGEGHGRKHWSANFDEVQDFENQLRSLSEAIGLMSDEDFAATQDPLGVPKKGHSVKLDALAAYVDSLTEMGVSPHRNEDTSLTLDAIAGKQIFHNLNCASCHSGAAFTDSESGAMHDVGTLTALSGLRLGSLFTDVDTPTLGGLWRTAPYLHDGSAARLEDVFTIGQHQVDTAGLSSGEFDDLIAYILQIDDYEMGNPPASGEPLVAFNSPVGDFNADTGMNLTVDVNAADPAGTIVHVKLYKDDVEFARTEDTLPYTWSGSDSDTELANLQAGTFVLTARATDNEGNFSETSITVIVSGSSDSLLSNPSFEEGETGWNLGLNTSISTENAPFGSNMLTMTTGAGNTVQTVAIEPDTEYILSFWALASELTSGGARLDTSDKFDQGFTPGGTCQFNIETGDAQVWTKYVGTFNSASETSVTIRTYQNGMQGTVHFDKIQLVVAPMPPDPDPYEVWKTDNNITDDYGDEDYDGISNLLEFALGGDPRSALSGERPVITVNGNSVDFVFRRNEASVTYIVQFSEDLVEWDLYRTVTDSHGTVGNDAIVTVPESDVSNGRIFLRLKVEK